jgi:hypothetical protein
VEKAEQMVREEKVESQWLPILNMYTIEIFCWNWRNQAKEFLLKSCIKIKWFPFTCQYEYMPYSSNCPFCVICFSKLKVSQKFLVSKVKTDWLMKCFWTLKKGRFTETINTVGELTSLT